MNPIGRFLDHAFPEHEKWEARAFRGVGVIKADNQSEIAWRDLEFYGDPPSPAVGDLRAEQIEPAGDPWPLPKYRMRVCYGKAFGDLALTKRNLVYTPSGFAWVGGRIDDEASMSTPGTMRHIYHALKDGGPLRVPETLPSATVIQAHSRRTYGDWIPCFMRRLVLAGDIPQPLLLPYDLRNRSYIHTDLKALGIEYRFCETPVRVQECHVLRQPFRQSGRPSGHNWSPEQLAEFRAKKPIDVPTPEPGSLVYLSRMGVKSNLRTTLERDTRTELAEEIVTSLGGRVVRSEGMGFADFATLAHEVETLVSDHGAAMCNLVQWSPRQVVELVSEDWWSWSFVPLSEAAGVERYTLLRPRRREAAEFEGILSGVLEQATGRTA